MEELLNKNIFLDKDLFKLSPDYVPSSVLMRMHMRRITAKDSHEHNEAENISNAWQRNKKQQRNGCQINTEIVKIRNGFKKINLKNQIMLKNAIKHVDSLGSKDLALCAKDDDTIDDCEPDFEDFSVNDKNLEICNHKDFTMNNKVKQKRPKVHTRPNIKTKPVPVVDECILNSEDSSEEMMRVECKLLKEKYGIEDLSPEIAKEPISNEIEKVENDLQPITGNAIENPIKDLQNLLVMMAIDSRQSYEDIVTDTPREINSETTSKTEINDSHNLTALSNVWKADHVTNILNVTPIRIQFNSRDKFVAQKYFEKWKRFIESKKDDISRQREVTLNKFFDKLAKKKQELLDPRNTAKQIVKDVSTYQHRYKVQRHIIALQKAKLEEQSRMIEELKYNKIVEASKHSVDAMREEVRKTYYEIDRQLKPKIKCLTNELKIPEIDETSLVLHCLKVPQFLQRMEKRAREREEKHAMIRERRRQMEEERVRMKQQAELAKTEMDKEEKLRRMKDLRVKRKKEKMDTIRKKQYAERMRALTVMAELHYEKTLTAKYGIRPFRILIAIKKDNIEKAKAHYKFQLKKNVFLHWMWHTEDIWHERNFIAEDFHRKKILRWAFKRFRENHRVFVLKRQTAEDYYDFYISKTMFQRFCEGIAAVKKEGALKWQMAVAYHNSNILFKTLTYWRTLPALNAIRREQEARKARWREKVLQVVPDYVPPDD